MNSTSHASSSVVICEVFIKSPYGESTTNILRFFPWKSRSLLFFDYLETLHQRRIPHRWCHLPLTNLGINTLSCCCPIAPLEQVNPAHAALVAPSLSPLLTVSSTTTYVSQPSTFPYCSGTSSTRLTILSTRRAHYSLSFTPYRSPCY